MDMMPPQKDGNATNLKSTTEARRTAKLSPLMFTDDTDQERSGDLVIARDRVIGKPRDIAFPISAILAIFPISVISVNQW
jgi:hypothetical protein